MSVPTRASRPRPCLVPLAFRHRTASASPSPSPWRTVAAIACALTLSATVACGGSDGPSGPQGPENGSMTATVNGNAWSANTVTAVINNGFLGLGGVSATSDMAFGVAATGPGTYSIPESSGLNFNYIDRASGHQWQALGMGTQLGGVGSGTMTITTFTESRVVGTFSYTAPAIERTGAPGSASVTNGKFDISY